MKKKMTKEQVVKQMDTEHLLLAVRTGVGLAAIAPTPEIRKAIRAEMNILSNELLSRGIKVTLTYEHDQSGREVGCHMEVKELDLLALSETTLPIPSPSSIINGKVATDLPKHGYLTKR